jgi:hypothetical protein
MRKYINSFKRLNLIFSVFIVLAVLVLVIALLQPRMRGSRSSRQETAVQPQIDNKTLAFQVVNLTQQASEYVLSIKNISNKNVNGYSLASGGYSKDSDLTIGDQVISPGEIAEVIIPKDASDTGPQIIRILAVFFEDHTDEGEPSAVKRIKDRRLGKKLQLKRILPLIKAALDTADSNPAAALASLKTKVASLSEEPETVMSRDVRTGLRSAKQDLLTELEKINEANLREKLTLIQEQHKKRLTRLGLT